MPLKLTSIDSELRELIAKTDHKTAAIWAANLAEKYLPYFEEKYTHDDRPGKAIEYLRNWIKRGILKMAEVRKASLDSHAAARDAEKNSPAQFAARACGQAAATPHVKTHSLGAHIYGLKVIEAATHSDEEVAKELKWQKEHLLKVIKENEKLPKHK